MNYEQTINYLYNAAPAFEKVGAGAYKEGLTNTLALDEHFGHPHRSYKTIHVAGTNGKGSCSHTLAAILQCAGYKVGLYTSPHIIDFRERIKVNGRCIPKERVVRFVEEERSFFEPLHGSFFELTTALAFKYFEEEAVDIAVIEVGLGGRLDCTNIITPLLSVITNISFDHTQFLGNTLEKIAGEKAGIIKHRVPCVIGEYTEETRPVFEHKAKEMEAPIVFAEDNEIENNIDFELKGSYQVKNKNTILNTVSVLRKYLTISDANIKKGLANVCELTGLQGRWQTLSDNPLTICDTGHNLAGWEYLSKQIKETADKLKKRYERAEKTSVTRIVFGMVDDKDIKAVIKLLPADAEYYFCQAQTHRAIKAEIICKMANERGLHGRFFHSVELAYEKALADSDNSDFIFIGGSSYVVADLLSISPKATI
jgi:dihydrofolate synthase/folylpolyglutamate synthase